MNRRTEFEKEIRRTPPSPTLRFSRTFDLLLNQFPDSIENSDVNLNQNSRMSSTATKSNIWRTSIAAPICAFCNKSVFPAEELNAAGQKFHKLCLKCSSFTEFSDVFRVWEENEFSSIFSKLSHTSQSRKSRWTWKEDLLFVVLPSPVRPTRSWTRLNQFFVNAAN